MKDLQDKLSAPFTQIVNGKEVPAHKWKLLTNKGDVVPYITAAQVKQRLNEVFGVEGWQSMLSETTKNFLICDLQVKINNEWVSKADVGTESDYAAEKGMASDAIKRAAKSLGIGAYLDNLPHLKFTMKGNSVVTDKGQLVSKYDGKALSDYINTGCPMSTPLRMIYSALSEDSQKKYSEMFKEIFDELS